MMNIMKSQSGNIALTMLLVVIGMMSGLSISSMSLRDTIAAQAEYESIQGLHILRGEVFRAQAFLETATKENPSLGGGVRTPIREVALSSSHLKKTFSMQSHMYRRKTQQEGYNVDGETGGTGVSSDEYLVRSLVQSKLGVGQVAYFSRNESMVRKYSEMIVIQKTSPVWMYFTDDEEDPLGEAVRFDGKDYFDGPVHSNTDIWIRQTSGNNQGWPRFDGLVTTSGVIRVYPDGGDNFPEDLIFRGGLLENYDEYQFPSTMEKVRANGRPVGPPYYSDKRIVFVEVDGSGYSGYMGTIQDPEPRQWGAWPDYPISPYANNVPPAFINRFSVRDTLWTILPGGSCLNSSMFVNSKLWIRGKKTDGGHMPFASMQTWGAADTLYILGDILLQGTTVPNSPESNRSSMVGLISEKSVLIKYGFYNPADTMRHHTNMGSDALNYGDPNAGGGIWIYAAIAALGDGGDNSFEDGVFTFEYQHPHGSIPDVVINVPGIGDTLFQWIDLHRYHWPQTTINRWPANIDFPWYNPLWPEREPYLMRGTINIWGGVSQKRRGFVRRNYVNQPDNNPNGLWNIPVDQCGGTTAPNPINVQLWANPAFNIVLLNRHYPGTNTAQVGYRKNYRYDNRMYTRQPPDWPEFEKQGERLPMTQGNWLLKRPPRSLV